MNRDEIEARGTGMDPRFLAFCLAEGVDPQDDWTNLQPGELSIGIRFADWFHGHRAGFMDRHPEWTYDVPGSPRRIMFEQQGNGIWPTFVQDAWTEYLWEMATLIR